MKNMNPKQAKKLRSLIRAYAAWRVDDSWKGSSEPESIAETERELELASKKLNAFIRSLTEPPSSPQPPARSYS